MPVLAYTPTEATSHQSRSIPFHSRAVAPSPAKPSPSATARQQHATTYSVPLTPTYLAQASAYHLNSLASSLHARKSSRSANEDLTTIDESQPSTHLQPSGKSKHERRPSNRKGLTLKPALRIRTVDRPDSAKIFQAKLSAPPHKHVTYSALSPFSQPGTAEKREAADADLETGEAYDAFAPQNMTRRESVGEKLVKAWPWQWRPKLVDPEWSKGVYAELRDEKGLPMMVPRRGSLRDDRKLLRVFVVLLGAAVVLQTAIVFGIGGVRWPC